MNDDGPPGRTGSEAAGDVVPQSRPANNTERGHTRLTCYCATDFDSVSPLLHAYKDSDTAALAGLLARKKAIELAEGTTVYIAGTDAGVATVLVESGYHSGERCYLWGKFIQ